MESNIQTRNKNIAANQTLLILGIIFVAFNLRPAITSVGPLVGFIRTDLGLSNGEVGFITTLPLLAFAALSFLAPKIGRKIGDDIAILLGLFLLTAGLLMRVTGLTFMLFAGTAIAGIGIAICNVLLPAIVKQKFPSKVGLMTGLYTASLSGFAAIASGISIPLAVNIGLGWKTALIIWACLSIAAIIIWFPQIKKANQIKEINTANDVLQPSLLRSKLAWLVTFFIGLQSWLFYCLITWLPAILQNHGMTEAASGWMLGILQLIGLPASFLTPVIADKLKDQRGIVITISALYVLGFTGLLIVESASLTFLWIFLIGIAQGAGFSLALTFFVLRTSTARQASALSGMAQSFGYFLAGIGPILIGSIFDHTQSWTMPLITLMAVVIAMLAAGMGAGEGLVYKRIGDEVSE